MRSKKTDNQCAWVNVDQELLLLKQGSIKTKLYKNSNQIYKLRVAKWGNYQAVIEKRLYCFSQAIMDYKPGRLMGLNLEDMQIIFENKDKILQIMQKTFDDLQETSIYKRQILFHKQQEQKKLKQKKQENKK